MFGGDLDQAEKYATSTSDKPENTRISAYEQIIKAYIAARREDYAKSTEMLGEALLKIIAYHHEFSNESSSKLPTISLEERLVLSSTLSRLAGHVSSPQQANLVFRLEQFLNRDKAKLSLSARVARLSANSDLQREDLRTRDRLKDLRERIMLEAVRQLISRMVPVQPYQPSNKNDFAFLLRLEQIEGKISTIDKSVKRPPKQENEASEGIVSLEEARTLLKSDEAIVSHVILPGQGLVISCVTADRYQFEVAKLSPPEIKQLLVDDKLVSASLRSINEPSPELNSLFPAESAFQLYRTTLGPIESCLDRKRSIFLATDADLFSTPWNALLTEFDISKPFRHKTAAWMVRSFSVSLLPSVASLSQLRLNMLATAATQNFLGIGDPEFSGRPDPSVQIALAPLIGTRGVGSRDAIKQLPRLPEAGVEVRSEGKILGASKTDLLLGSNANERAFRSKELEKYKVISFATHALVAGEADGFTEPALVLSPGDEDDNPKNDGLLTATEIADLSLDANLVILSACNTAAPDGRINSRGLSGLADAFFFAGARSLAVTQWAVYSDAAERIGTGLIAKSAENHDLGVAEALRETALDFISSQRDDYMAHPRFWAAFIVAGDGSVAALSANYDGTSDSKIQIHREFTLEPHEQSELISIAPTTDLANYAIGLALPPADGEPRAGSYVVRIGATGNVTVLDLDREMAASQVFALGNNIGVTGYYPIGCKSCPKGEGKWAAVFKLLGRDAKEQWKVVRQSDNVIIGHDIIKAPFGYILTSLETKEGVSESGNSIWLTAVSADGKLLRENQIHIPFILPRLSKGATIDASGDLVLAIGGNYPASKDQSSPIQFNPLTGTRTITCPSSTSSLIFSIDLQTFAVRKQLETTDGSIASIRFVDGDVFGIQNVNKDCQQTKAIRLIQVDKSRKSRRTLFQTEITNSVDATDFEITNDGFLVVGRVWLFLPPVLANPTMSIEQLQNFSKTDFLDPSRSDKYDFVTNAFILSIRRDGKFVGDKVIHDARDGYLSSIASRGVGHYVSTGSASGDRGWVVDFSERTN